MISASEADAMSIDDLLAEATPRTSSARVVLRQDLLDEHEALESELTAAMAAGDGDRASGLAEQIVSLEPVLERATRTFRFRAVGHLPWRQLLAKHPPTAQQLAVHKGLDHDPSRFPLVAVQASCIDPVMTLAQVEKLASSIALAEWDTLWQACLDVNIGAARSTKSAAAAKIRAIADAASAARATS